MGVEVHSSMDALGMKSLESIQSSEPPQWLAPPPDLSEHTRAASKYLFSELLPSVPKCPLPSLLTDNFDAEQIWQQIDLQARPLLSSARSRLSGLEKSVEALAQPMSNSKHSDKGIDDYGVASEDDFDAMDVSGDEEDSQDEDSETEEEEEDDEDEDDGEDVKEKEGRKGTVEDKFFKMNDLEKFLDQAEDAYVMERDGGKKEEDDDDEDEEEDDEERLRDENEEIGSDEEHSETIMYDDFFGDKKKTSKKRKLVSDSDSEEEAREGEDEDELLHSDREEVDDKESKGRLSTHEREKAKIKRKIEELEKENLESKSWLMQGEVTAAKRPKNSALEVQLDFDHNSRPAPVITEEFTASIEDIIKRRIIEENFDDVQPKPCMPTTAPKEKVEIDENKSSKGLAEIYETEYMQNTGLAAPPVSSSDALKNEATRLFKALCLKLDALSHFHFTPKPVIEDMSVQANVPALAMEEVAPVAISDASMLAPEELFSGKGAVKEKDELTKEDRKRLRAKKKRKHKASKERTHNDRRVENGDGNGEPLNARRKGQKQTQTHFGKSSKVFSDLDKAKDKAPLKPSQKTSDAPNPSFLKL